MQTIYQFFSQFPDWLATFFLAMLPITELRGSIPFAVGYFNMPVWLAFAVSVIGDIIPGILIVWFLRPVSLWLSRRSKIFSRFFNWWFNKVIKRFEKKYLKYGEIALLIFVSIPLPITGVWTGSVAAFLFGIPRKRAIIFISIGAVIAGVLVSLITTGVFSFV
ncbi:MAG TPA: small multi-drug export protein [Patescibacteria group bacterium]|nr:small multi-drug export protein [Patescibacteria group bacterium]